MITRALLDFAGTLGVCGLVAAGTLPARADITLAGRQTVRAGASAPVVSAVSLRCRGADTRLESGGPVLLHDGKANVLYEVHPERRRYSLSVPAPVDPADEVSLSADEIKIETKLEVRKTGRAQTLAGLPAQEYSVHGAVTYTLLRPGRIPARSDDAEARERDARRRRRAAYLPPQWSVTGRLWLADTAALPAGQNSLLAAELIAAGAGPFGGPLAEALGKRRGLPLGAQITVTHTPPLPNALPSETATDFAALSVSQAALDTASFRPPPAYALVAAPPVPFAPGLNAVSP